MLDLAGPCGPVPEGIFEPETIRVWFPAAVASDPRASEGVGRSVADRADSRRPVSLTLETARSTPTKELS